MVSKPRFADRSNSFRFPDATMGMKICTTLTERTVANTEKLSKLSRFEIQVMLFATGMGIMDPEVQKQILGDREVITCRPADLIEPGLAKFDEEIKEWKQQDEDVLSYALFPQVAVDFFKYRKAQQDGIDLKKADTKNGAYPA